MTPQDFRRLTETYGASPQRWPKAVRAQGEALVARGDPDALAALALARELDTYLASHKVAPPDVDLIRSIVRSASISPPSLWRRSRVWFSGAGLIGAGAAGVLAGALVISAIGPAGAPEFSDQNYAQTVFSGSTPEWSDE
jgi:hypothetical protein